MELRFKKFVFHHFEHSTKSLKRAETEIKKELAEEELKNIEQSKEIEIITKKINNKKINNSLKKVRKRFRTSSANKI
jgi:hypothetical protein